MATNVVSLSVYQINQGPPIALTDVVPIAFPSQGCILRSCQNSATRDLGNGISVYGVIQTPITWSSTGTSTLYYVQQTLAQLVTLFNA